MLGRVETPSPPVKMKNENCEKRNKFWKLPDILIIMIKQYNDNTRKLDKSLEYPMDLDMEPYCLNYKNECIDYELQSLCIHNGSLNGGHYYALCKNMNDDKWREYNDEHSLNRIRDSRSSKPSHHSIHGHNDPIENIEYNWICIREERPQLSLHILLIQFYFFRF